MKSFVPRTRDFNLGRNALPLPPLNPTVPVGLVLQIKNPTILGSTPKANIPQNQNKAVFVVNSLEETSDVKVRLLCWLTQYEHGFQKNQFCVILSISKASLTKMVLCESHFGHKAQVGKNFGQKSKLKIYFEQPREHLLLPLCHPTPHTRLHHSVVRRF